MQGNENSTTLYNICSFSYADWERNFRQSVAATPCDYLMSASVFTILINLLLICVSFRELPSCVID